MSSFDTLARSREDSQILEVYDVTLGTTSYRWTNAEDTITLDSVDYTPQAIIRSAIKQGAKSEDLTVTVPANNALVVQYLATLPGVRGDFTVRELERDESPAFNTRRQTFAGVVTAVSFTEDFQNARILIRNLESGLDRAIPRFTFKSSCNHILYDNRCQVDPSSFNITGAVSLISERVITVTGANSQADKYWTGGYVATTSGAADFRLITAHSGNDLTLLLPFSRDLTGQNVQVFAGCDHLVAGDCATKFDNVANYGGYPFVPNRNIFAKGVEAV